jgi:hypothetical protein
MLMSRFCCSLKRDRASAFSFLLDDALDPQSVPRRSINGQRLPSSAHRIIAGQIPEPPTVIDYRHYGNSSRCTTTSDPAEGR